MICFALDFGQAYVFKSLAYSSTCLYHTVHWRSSTTCSSSISVTNQLISSGCESKTMPATFQPLTSGCSWCSHLATHTHTHLTALFPGLPGWAGTRKVKPIWILLKQETVSVSGISSAICKSASCSRQITTPASHHSVFYRPDALPASQPTASKH